MATPLDIGLLSHVGVIFPLLLVFFVIYAVLQKTEVFGDNKGLSAIIALCCAFLLLLSPNLVKVIQLVTPWFVFAVIMIMFFLVILMFSGYKWETLVQDMTGGTWGSPQWFLLIIFIIFVIGGLSSVYGNAFLPFTDSEGGQAQPSANVTEGGEQTTDTGSFNVNVGRVVFHPKILGLAVVLVIFSFAIRLLAKAE